MQLRMLLLGVALSSLLSACVDSPENQSTVEKTSNFEIAGLPAKEFYNQFVYRLEGQCGEKSEFHRFAGSFDEVKVNVNSLGKDILAEIRIVLNADGRFTAKYREVIIEGYTPYKHWKPESERVRVITGSWRVREDRLELEHLGVAHGYTYNQSPAFDLLLKTDLVTEGLKGQAFSVGRIASRNHPIAELNPCQTNGAK
jgi:hypothetical protein